ncbi:type I polyketide synthase [Psychromonas sp. Urea-02u-13]|uniref:type I polyketide synthase n=1 Tax=Psychromonas sp. Urea-02u-13 TaxID=2058326 RepID=UPI001E53D500|nr:type I polyketide synthase [Psychromonas sp. Urea-02u-13]
MSNEKNPDVIETEEDKKLNSRLQSSPIAIVGMASVFAETKNLEQFWDNIVESVNGIKDIPEDRWAIDDYYSSDKKAADKTYCKRGGFLPEIDFDPMEFGLPPNILELTDITQLMSLVVARDVLADAGISDEAAYDRDKIGITLGVGGGQKQIAPLTSRLQGPILDKVLKASGVSDSDRDVIIEKYKKAYIPWEENSFPGMLGNVIAGRIANRFDFGGTNCVVDAACAGSLAAIKMAVSDLLEHRSEMMISGGVCCDNSPFMYMSFSKTPAFTDGDDIRPFDENSKGMMIGEGVGMIALKRLEDAERDGDKIYALIKGIGSSSDGRFKSIYAPRPSGQVKALKRAYQDAGFEPSTCGLIEAHGTGTKAGDAAEFSGLNTMFSENNDQKQHIALGSVKSQVGHTKAAAGTAGIIKAALALHHKVLPATINVDKPNPSLEIENSPLYVNSETRPWMPRADGVKRRAGVSSFGFGGTNFHFVMEEYKATHDVAYRLNEVPQTLVISATNKATLTTTLTAWLNKLSVETDLQAFAFNALVIENPFKTPSSELARCGFIAKNALQAIEKITQVLKQLENDETSWSKPTGIYYRESAIEAQGKVVALFSGQGSQYVNMGRDLTCNFPTMLATSAKMDKSFSDAGQSQLSSTVFPLPVFTDAERKTQDENLRLTQNAQPAIGTFSAGLFNTFKQAGLIVDFAAGHSFGELTALWAAGVLSEQDYMLLARSRGAAMAAPEGSDLEGSHFDAGTMAAVVGDPEKVAADIEAIEGVSIANYNSNNQVVIAGVTVQIELAVEQLQAKGYKVVKLPVSAAFHTELVGHAQKPFADVIDSVEFNTPSIPVFANGTAKAHSNNADEIKATLKNHILQSVHFNEEIDNLYDAGGRVFIEFGPKNVLTRLVDNILKDKNDVVTIAVNSNPKKSADQQLRLAAVEMAVLGLQLENIDPYSAQQRPVVAPKKSPLAMKLTGAAYVNPKTKKAFSDALNDGWTISSAEPKVVVKEVIKEVIVEKVVEKIVEVEKIVYVQQNGAPATTNNPTENNAVDVASSIERSVENFVNHQSQLLEVHQSYMQGPKEYAKTFQEVLAAQTGATELPESLDKTLGLYHDFQSETLRVHETYLNSQTENMGKMLANLTDAPIATVTASKQSVVTKSPVSAPLTAKAQPAANNIVPITAAKPVSAPVQVAQTVTQPKPQVTLSPAPVRQPSPVVKSAPAFDLNKIQTVMLDVVAEKTGYPTEMLELSMDMEADLGIDSIKRVEILGSVQDEITDLPELNPEDLAELRTLGEIVDYMKSNASAVAPVASAPVATSIDLDKIQNVMMSVVADKTGYPTEMLELSMDMEADLGIDSIKRVEILGSVQDEITDLPELNPEDLAELRTLGEIVDYMKSKASAVAPVATSVAPVASIDLDKIQNVMMSVVADKTGYPTEMLELSMDMEADLGIDSIKRVEILGAVQDEITDLPELNPEDLAELRTLGEIVDYMKSKASAVSATAVSAAPIASVTTASIDLDKIQNVMMSVVADKTGYPTEMLELSMDMEADLGIDSIKRVEILGAVQDEITDLPELNPEDLAELRTLGEIVNYMQSKAGAATPIASASVAAVSIDLEKIQNVMMSVVADKTGYPTEMLELSMDMEADLGIDSIKRVEILGAVQDEITDLPELNPEDLAELRTLGEIVNYMQSKAGAVSSASVASAPVAVSIDLDKIQNVMMSVVADKTGYPTEMLELSMDMEADLGIDSIKRVEILGAVQDEITDLPELNPEDLAELRTLGEIVSYMQSKAGAIAPAGSIESTPAPVAIDLDKIQSVMMSVVADKTGYPAEMLELAMDMEADLGIDSIKRVEILGAVQDEITDLPELNPEDLAELRTLGEIVSYMQSKAGSAVQSETGTSVKKPEGIETIVTTTTINNDFAPSPSSTVVVKHLDAVTSMSPSINGENLLLVDDGEGSAVRLAEKLNQQGWSVTVLKPSWVTTVSSKSFSKAVNIIELEAELGQVDEKELQAILATQLTWHAVVYLQAKTAIEGIEFPQASKQGLQLAFLLAKLTGLAKNDATTNNTDVRSSFLVLTRQGGCFGVENNEHNSDLVQTGLAGLVKTISHEWPNVFCRVIDVARKFGADKVANIVFDELNDSKVSPVEIGFNNNGRLTLVGEKTDSYALQSGNSIDENSLFLVSGGAKGVTAHCVIRLAQTYQSKFILLGRSKYESGEPSWANGVTDEVALKKAAMQHLIASGEKPTPVAVNNFIKPVLANREITKTLDAIQAAGGIAQYVSADVTDKESVLNAVSPITDLWGDITGLIHGAGVLADKFIEQKTLSDLEAVYSTKIDGLLSMLACVETDKIKHLVMFSSAAGFYGNPGQSDYSMANDILNKTAFRFKALNPEAQVVSFNWGPWDGGMVTPELKRMFNDRGVYIIPLDAGAQLLVSELAADTNRCAQILVGNDMGGEDESSAEEVSVKKPLVSRYTKNLLATNNAFFADHQIGDNQVFPTVCAIAWMVEAAESAYSGYHYLGLKNYKLFKGIIFDGSQAEDYVIDLVLLTDSELSDSEEKLEVEVKISSETAGKTTFHYSAILELVKNKESAPVYQGELPTLATEQHALYENGTLFHGETLQGITAINRCDEQGLLLSCVINSSVKQKQGEFDVSTNNVFANDLVYQALLVWVRQQLGLGSLPTATAQWTVYQEVPVDQPFYVQLTLTTNKRNKKVIADVQMINQQKQILASVIGAQVTASESLNDLFLKVVK